MTSDHSLLRILTLHSLYSLVSDSLGSPIPYAQSGPRPQKPNLLQHPSLHGFEALHDCELANEDNARNRKTVASKVEVNDA